MPHVIPIAGMFQTKLAAASSLGCPAHKPLEGSVFPQLLRGCFLRAMTTPSPGCCFLGKGPKSPLNFISTADCVPFYLRPRTMRATLHPSGNLQPDLSWLGLIGPLATILVPQTSCFPLRKQHPKGSLSSNLPLELMLPMCPQTSH